jgi:hypothetical protein
VWLVDTCGLEHGAPLGIIRCILLGLILLGLILLGLILLGLILLGLSLLGLSLLGLILLGLILLGLSLLGLSLLGLILLGLILLGLILLGLSLLGLILLGLSLLGLSLLGLSLLGLIPLGLSLLGHSVLRRWRRSVVLRQLGADIESDLQHGCAGVVATPAECASHVDKFELGMSFLHVEGDCEDFVSVHVRFLSDVEGGRCFKEFDGYGQHCVVFSGHAQDVATFVDSV